MKNWSYRKLTWEPYGSSAIWVRRLKSESKEEKRKREGENAERRERNKEMKFAGILGVNAQHTHTHVDLSVNFLTSTVQFVWLKTTLIFILYALCLTLFFFFFPFFFAVLIWCWFIVAVVQWGIVSQWLTFVGQVVFVNKQGLVQIGIFRCRPCLFSDHIGWVLAIVDCTSVWVSLFGK